MPSIRFRLDKPTLSGLAARVAAEYGPEARIVDTEESVVGGLGGLFGRRVIDVVVEVPGHAAPTGTHEFSTRSRVGLAALLDEADAQDLQPAPALPSASPRAARQRSLAQVSTQGGEFASVLDALRVDVDPSTGPGGTPARPARRRAEPPATAAAIPVQRPARPADPGTGPRALAAARRLPPEALMAPPRALALAPTRPRAASPAPIELEAAAAREHAWATPAPRSRTGRIVPGSPPPQRTGAGDLLLLVGLAEDAVRVAQAVRDRLQKGYVCDGGSVEGHTRRRVDDRRGAIAARAYAVRSEQPVIVAYGIGDGDVDEVRFSGLFSIDSDQSWLVLDAGRRPEQTLEWTSRLRGRLQIDAVASLRAPAEGAHGALAAIGLPEAWRELAS